MIQQHAADATRARSDSDGGFGFGLLLASFWFGFRHGIDWDHIAAITDITSSQEERGRAIGFGTLYVVGHALVVLCLGTSRSSSVRSSRRASMPRWVGSSVSR